MIPTVSGRKAAQAMTIDMPSRSAGRAGWPIRSLSAVYSRRSVGPCGPGVVTGVPLPGIPGWSPRPCERGGAQLRVATVEVSLDHQEEQDGQHQDQREAERRRDGGRRRPASPGRPRGWSASLISDRGDHGGVEAQHRDHGGRRRRVTGDWRRRLDRLMSHPRPSRHRGCSACRAAAARVGRGGRPSLDVGDAVGSTTVPTAGARVGSGVAEVGPVVGSDVGWGWGSGSGVGAWSGRGSASGVRRRRGGGRWRRRGGRRGGRRGRRLWRGRRGWNGRRRRVGRGRRRWIRGRRGCRSRRRSRSRGRIRRWSRGRVGVGPPSSMTTSTTSTLSSISDHRPAHRTALAVPENARRPSRSPALPANR